MSAPNRTADPLALLTVPEAAEVLSMDARSVYRLIAEHRIGHVKVGTGKRGSVRIARHQLAAFIADATVEARP